MEFDGQLVRYFDIGRGVPVVYVHGFCMSSESCENMVPSLRNRVRLVGIDLPGFGGSEPDEGLNSIVGMAEWLKRVLEKLNLDRFILTGHSMGGYIGLEFAKLYPECLIGLVLLNSTALPDRSFKKEERNRVAEHIQRYGYEAWLKTWIKTLFHTKRIEFLERVEELCKKAKVPAVVNALAAMRDREDSTQFLNQTKIPILFVAGEHDNLITYSELRPMIIDSPSSRLIMVENTGHMSPYEDAEACADSIVSMMTYMSDADRERF